MRISASVIVLLVTTSPSFKWTTVVASKPGPGGTPLSSQYGHPTNYYGNPNTYSQQQQKQQQQQQPQQPYQQPSYPNAEWQQYLDRQHQQQQQQQSLPQGGQQRAQQQYASQQPYQQHAHGQPQQQQPMSNSGYYYSNADVEEETVTAVDGETLSEQAEMGVDEAEQGIDDGENAVKDHESSSSPLPPGWTEHWDPSSGQPYYYNSLDGTTTWDRPSVEAIPVGETEQEEGSPLADDGTQLDVELDVEKELSPSLHDQHFQHPETTGGYHESKQEPEQELAMQQPAGRQPEFESEGYPERNVGPSSSWQSSQQHKMPQQLSTQPFPSMDEAMATHQRMTRPRQNDPLHMERVQPQDGHVKEPHSGQPPSSSFRPPPTGMMHPQQQRHESASEDRLHYEHHPSKTAAEQAETSVGMPPNQRLPVNEMTTSWQGQTQLPQQIPPEPAHVLSQSGRQQPPPGVTSYPQRQQMPPHQQQQQPPQRAQQQQQQQQQDRPGGPFGRPSFVEPRPRQQEGGTFGTEHPEDRHREQWPARQPQQGPPVQGMQHQQQPSPMRPQLGDRQQQQPPPQQQQQQQQQLPSQQQQMPVNPYGTMPTGNYYGRFAPPQSYYPPQYGQQYDPNYAARQQQQQQQAHGLTSSSSESTSLIQAPPTSGVRDALDTAWKGLLGFGSRTKDAVESARETVLTSAREAGQSISSTSSSLWGQAQKSLGSVFESNNSGNEADYSLSGRYGVPQPNTRANQGYPYPQQGRYGEGYGQQTPPQQQQQQPGQTSRPGMNGQDPRLVRYPPMHPRYDPAYPNQQTPGTGPTGGQPIQQRPPEQWMVGPSTDGRGIPDGYQRPIQQLPQQQQQQPPQYRGPGGPGPVGPGVGRGPPLQQQQQQQQQQSRMPPSGETRNKNERGVEPWDSHPSLGFDAY